MSGTKRNAKPTIIIRKEEVVEGGHHGGAWKVAYADFVTAMMAFFLLMWLLNATTEAQRIGLADYFSPSSVTSHNSSGFGAPFGGLTPNVEGSLASDRGAVQLTPGPTHPIMSPDDSEDDDSAPSKPRTSGPSLLTVAQDDGAAAQAANGQAPNVQATEPADAARPPAARMPPVKDPVAEAEREQRERNAFERAAEQIREAVRADPALAGLAKQLAIDLTPEGLRIQILDEDRQPMFGFGTSALNDRARALLSKVAPVLLRLTQPIAIDGHTDAAPYRGGDRSNWDLSAERANATRRLLTDAGLPEARIRSVAGHADRDPLLPAEPLAAANRRIAVLVLRDRPVAGGR
jgi:chemotaxis protein MotB